MKGGKKIEARQLIRGELIVIFHIQAIYSYQITHLVVICNVHHIKKRAVLPDDSFLRAKEACSPPIIYSEHLPIPLSYD